MAHDLIRITGLEIDCIVGVRPLERQREQRVHLDLALGLDLAPAGRTGRIALTCDYDQIAEEIIALLRFRRYRLIEMATEELAAMLLGVHRALDFVEIRLDKPAALDGRARAASVEVRRSRDDFPPRREPTPWGKKEVLLETREAGLYRLMFKPQGELESVLASGERALEWLISGELSRNGAALERHSPADRSLGEPHSAYKNPSAKNAFLFRCICPPSPRMRSKGAVPAARVNRAEPVE